MCGTGLEWPWQVKGTYCLEFSVVIATNTIRFRAFINPVESWRTRFSGIRRCGKIAVWGCS